MLEKIEKRADLLALSPEEEQILCADIRSFLVEHVSQTGGHLASNLGVVELTVALHKVYDPRRTAFYLMWGTRLMFIKY